MKKTLTFQFIEQTADTITFAQTVAPANFLRFKVSRKKFTQNGVEVPTVTTNTLMSFDEEVKKCEDSCAASATMQRTVRVITTGRRGDQAQLVEDLRALVGYLAGNPTYFNGFQPVAGSNITIESGL